MGTIKTSHLSVVGASSGSGKATKTFSGGSSGGGDMEARMTRVEEDVKEIKGLLSSLSPIITRIDERIKHVPTTFSLTVTMVVWVLTVLGIVVAFK